MTAIRRNRSATSAVQKDEQALVERLRAGDPAAFELLVHLHGGWMLAVARRVLSDEEDARDCVQDAFLQAFRGFDSFEERASLGTWLHRIVVNAALRKLRMRKRPSEESIENLLPQFDPGGLRLESLSQTFISVESVLENREVHDCVRHAIDQLPGNYREVLLLRDIEGYDTEEAAAALGLTPGNVKVRLHRARAALKTLLELILSGERR